MLQFKQRQVESERLPDRWKIGVDREHVFVYVGIAVVVGFVIGFVTSRTLTRRAGPTSLPAAAQTPARTSTDSLRSDFHRVTRIVRADTI
ncbi:MAG TPA: hypothetical protein VLU47_07555, partial [Blastocatellia bacterium]|nr:hypothetical protein [Blastocatellia bacterium]